MAAVKALASSISIGSGGAVGREGPIIQIGSTFGSVLAGWLGLSEWQRLTLIAAGGGGGIAATFNTPIGGVLFAVEILLVEISARTLIPVMIATGTASIIGRVSFGSHPSFVIPSLTLSAGPVPDVRVLAYLALGMILGVVGWFYARSIYWAEDFFDRLPVNDYVRHVIGMVLVGVTIYLLMRTLGHYYVEGVGYATIQDILGGSLTVGWVLVLLAVLKLLATALTLGSGASGGVFSPALFTGATLGAAFAVLVNTVLPSMHLDLANAAVIGMACLVGSSTGAAVTAVVMIFEMTQDYDVVIPLIVAVSVAYFVRRTLMQDTIYTLKLSRRGQRLQTSLQSQLYLARRALDFVHAPFVIASADGVLSDLPPTRGRRSPHVVLEGGDGSVTGVITAEALAAARRTLMPGTPLDTLADRRPAAAATSVQVFDVIAVLRAQRARVCVLTTDGQDERARSVAGVLTWADLVEHMNLSASLERAMEDLRVEATGSAT